MENDQKTKAKNPDDEVVVTIPVRRRIRESFKQVCHANRLDMKTVLLRFVEDVVKVHGLDGGAEEGVGAEQKEGRPLGREVC